MMFYFILGVNFANFRRKILIILELCKFGNYVDGEMQFKLNAFYAQELGIMENGHGIGCA
jgi:hypothetical protein